MTEKQFDQFIETAIENAADRFERRVEAGADRLDRGLTHAWNVCPCFRRGARLVSIGCAVSLLVLAKHLHDEDEQVAAHCCATLGGAALLWEVGRLVFLRRG